MRKGTKRDDWIRCERCKDIPDSFHLDMLESGNDTDTTLDNIMEMPGMKDADLSSGYKQWTIECDICKTRYLASVDVEPFVWDFVFLRERNGRAIGQFGGIVDLYTDDIL